MRKIFFALALAMGAITPAFSVSAPGEPSTIVPERLEAETAWGFAVRKGDQVRVIGMRQFDLKAQSFLESEDARLRDVLSRLKAFATAIRADLDDEIRLTVYAPRVDPARLMTIRSGLTGDLAYLAHAAIEVRELRSENLFDAGNAIYAMEIEVTFHAPVPDES